MLSPGQHPRRVYPPVLRRALLSWVGLSLLFSALGIVWLFVRDPLGVPPGALYRFTSLACALAALLIQPVWLAKTRAIRRAARATNGRLCACCGYNVSTLASSGTCPECGKHYNLAYDRRLWENMGNRYAG